MASHEARAAAAPPAPASDEDRLTNYLKIEDEFCAAEDYASLFAESVLTSNIVWRELVCSWAYDVVDMMGEARSVVYVSMNILDRFCAMAARSSTAPPMNEKLYECASMTALFLAARVAGTCNLQMSDLIHMSRGSVQLQDILSTGKQMLNILTWGHTVITPVDFLQAMLQSLPASVEHTRRTSLFESASFLAEIAVCDIYLSRFPASRVAFASILNSAFAENLLTNTELEDFCDQMEEKGSLVHSSIDTRAIRSRLDSVFNRIEDSHQGNSDAPHYVSDDEDEDNEDQQRLSSNSCKRAATHDECHLLDSQEVQENVFSGIAERPSKPTKRPPFRPS